MRGVGVVGIDLVAENSRNEDYGIRRLWDDGARLGCDFALPPNEAAARAALSKRALLHSCLIRLIIARA